MATPDAALATHVAGIEPVARLREGETPTATGRLMAWSPDGSELALNIDSSVLVYSSADWTAEPRTVRTLGLNFSCAWSPDGKMIATGDYNGIIHLWDSSGADTVQMMTDERFAYTGVDDIAFSPDGTRLAAAAIYVRLWSLPSGEALPSLEGEPYLVAAVAFSPDGSLLATGGLKGEVQVWDVATGKLKQSMKANDAEVTDVAFSPDGTRLAASKAPFTVQVFDVSSGDLKLTLEGPAVPADFAASRWANGVAFSPDGRLIAAGVYGYAVELWAAETGEPLRTLEAHSGPITALAFSPDGQMLASFSTDGTVVVWRVPQPSLIVD